MHEIVREAFSRVRLVSARFPRIICLQKRCHSQIGPGQISEEESISSCGAFRRQIGLGQISEQESVSVAETLSVVFLSGLGLMSKQDFS